jgi:hypothetical protein
MPGARLQAAGEFNHLFYHLYQFQEEPEEPLKSISGHSRGRRKSRVSAELQNDRIPTCRGNDEYARSHHSQVDLQRELMATAATLPSLQGLTQ